MGSLPLPFPELHLPLLPPPSSQPNAGAALRLKARAPAARNLPNLRANTECLLARRLGVAETPQLRLVYPSERKPTHPCVRRARRGGTIRGTSEPPGGGRREPNPPRASRTNVERAFD